MEVLVGATIFWLIPLGLLSGSITIAALGQKCVELVPNLIAGVLSYCRMYRSVSAISGKPDFCPARLHFNPIYS